MPKVAKWGNSLAVRLPTELGFEEGQEIVVRRAAAAELVIETPDDRKRRALAKLAALNWTLPEGYKFDREEANER